MAKVTKKTEYKQKPIDSIKRTNGFRLRSSCFNFLYFLTVPNKINLVLIVKKIQDFIFDGVDSNGCAEKVVDTAKRDSQVLPVFLSLGMDYEVTDKIDLGFEWGFFDTSDLSSTKPFFTDDDVFDMQTLSLHMAYKIS